MARVFLGTLLVFLAGCSEPGRDKNQQPSTKGTTPGTVDVTSLPCTPCDGDGYPPPAPELCVWATSPDALVWGRLTDVRIAKSPAVALSTGGWTWATGCPVIHAALELEVDISRSLRGSLTGKIIAHVGSRQKVLFFPSPRSDAGTAADWVPQQAGPTCGPLLLGQPIGLPLYYVPSLGVWSVTTERMFGVGADGHVFFQDGAACELFEPAPKGAAGMTPQQFDAAVAACTPDQATTAAAVQRRQVVLSNLAYAPQIYVAAVCAQPGP